MKKIDQIYKKIWTYDIWYDYIFIWDILELLYKWQKWEWTRYEMNSEFPWIIEGLLEIWEFKKDKLERQSDECIDFIYNLFINNKLLNWE